MLVNCYPPEDVFARVPELIPQLDPVLRQLDCLLDDDRLFEQVQSLLVQRYRLTAVHGRHSTPAEAILRLLVAKHLYAWSYQETVERVAESLVLRWFTRVYVRRVPTATTLLRWAQTIQPPTLHLRERPGGSTGGAGAPHAGPQTPGGWHGGGNDHPSPHRQRSLGRWGAGADAPAQTGPTPGGRSAGGDT